MLANEREASRRWDYGLAALAGLILLFVGLGTPGFWEPWESSLVQTAQFVRGIGSDFGAFWVPQNENHLVFRPLAQLWSLSAVFALSDTPSEFLLRLPGALVGLVILLTSFATMRRFFGRGAAWGALLALVSMPLFIFGARLLAGGIWTIAAVALPLELYLLACYADTARARQVYPAAFGLSLGFSFVAGGFFALGVVVLVLLAQLLWQRRRSAFRAFASRFFLATFALSLLVGGVSFAQYVRHVPRAIEDRLPIDAARLTSELEAMHVDEIGLRDGRLYGTFAESAWDKVGAERFVLSIDGNLLGTDWARAWALRPREMLKLEAALGSGKRLDDDGQPLDLALEPSPAGAVHTALRFFTYNLYDPALLDLGNKATVRSIVGAYPGLGIVHETPEQVSDFVGRLAQPLLGSPPDELSQAPTSPTLPSAKEKAQDTVKNGQEVTILGAADEAGWSEIELAGGKTGFVRTEILEPKPALGMKSFTLWVRFVGFGLFPWIALFPLVLGALLVRERRDERDDEREAFASLALFWLGASVLAMGLGVAVFNQRAFVGVVPFGLASGVLLGRASLWTKLDSAPMLRKGMGLAALLLSVVLLHDYKKFPWVFVESYFFEPEMQWAENLRVLETPFKLAMLVAALLYAAYFLNLVAWGNRVIERLIIFARERFDRPLRALGRSRELDRNWAELSPKAKLVRILYAPIQACAFVASVLFGAAQFLRRGQTVVALIAASFCALAVFAYLPAMSHHVTQKGLLERYQELAKPGEELVSLSAQAEKVCKVISDCEAGQACVRGRCKAEATSYYLGSVPNVQQVELLERLLEPERIFAIIPRGKLSRLNADFRKKFPDGERRNLAVLDTRSSRYLLTSNLLGEGETDENYVAALIFDHPPRPEYTPRKPVRFVNGLEFLGYDLDPDEVGSGEELTVTYYFHVTQDITQDWQMFLHIDYPGNRINGDHYPGSGEFHTNTWLAGDYIKDIQKLEIDRGSSAGTYELWFGFFSSGENRLKVETGEQDGGDRVRMGSIRVTGGI